MDACDRIQIHSLASGSTLIFGQVNGSVLAMRTSDCDAEMPLSSNENSPDSTLTFTVALGIINSVTFFGGRVQINLHQCKRLVDFYERARQFFDVLKRREVSVDEILYNNALGVLTKGQYLVYGYLEESWLKSVKTAGVNQDAFAKIYVELEDCFRLIYEKSEAGVVANYDTHDACREHKGSYPPIEFDTLAPLYFLDKDSRATLFEGDAQKDKEHMLRMIKGSGELDKEEGVWRTRAWRELLYTEEALAMEKLRTEQVEKEYAEALLKIEEAENMLRMKEAKKLWRKKQAGKLLRKEEALAKEKLRREQAEEELLRMKEAEKLWRKKEAGKLLGKEEAMAKEKLRREQAEEELLKLKFVLQQKEFEQEQRKQEETAGEDSKQEVQEVPNQEVLNETKVSSSKPTGLPQDFKIRSTEISLFQEIGSGGFATIHKCRWQNYDYAVKIFEGGDVDGLRAEVQNLVLLPRHPNIVLLVGFSIHKRDGRPMLVMELLDGDLHSLICTDKFKKKHQLTPGSEETLKETQVSRLLKGCCLGGQPDFSTPIEVGIGSIPIRVAIDFIYQIAKGMLFLHNRKVFHGDLKGKNVLFKQLPDGSVQLKIADFGVSEKLLIKREHSDIDSTIDLNCSCHSNKSGLGVRHGSGDGKAQVHGNIGTVRWMAPEVYGVTGGDMKPYSMKADVYSFAMTCVEILTGEHPFPHKRLSKDVKEHVNSGGRPDLSTVKDVPKALRDLVKRCWDADPLRRPDFLEIYLIMQTLKNVSPFN